MRQLSPQEFALAIAIAVSYRRTKLTRLRRLKTSYLDDCFEILDRPALSPKIRRFGNGVVRLEDARRAQLFEDTRELYEAMAPVIRELADGT